MIISEQTHDLVVHLTVLRNAAHPTTRPMMADLLSRVQSIHDAAVELEQDIGTNSGNLDDLTAAQQQEATA